MGEEIIIPMNGEVQMKDKKYKNRNIRWMLVLYDLLVYELSAILLLGLYGGNDKLSTPGIFQQMLLALLCVFATRLIGNVYGQIWRYGGMGQPVKIMDLAENMIRLSGVQGIEIVETGLRPGEKLYEELLVKTEELDKTSNSMIFIERDCALSSEEINNRLNMLREVCETGDDSQAREVLRKAVPTFRRPEEVNQAAEFAVHQNKHESNNEKAVAV